MMYTLETNENIESLSKEIEDLKTSLVVEW